MAVRMIIVVLVLLSSGCNWYDSKKVNWLHIIPDGYQGFLAVRFDCPDGTPLHIKNETIEIQYQANGTFCTSDAHFAWAGQVNARTRSGKPVEVNPFERKGFAMCCGGTRTVSHDDGPEYVFMIYWVGDLPERDALQANPKRIPDSATYNVESFLEDRFGIPKPDRMMK